MTSMRLLLAALALFANTAFAACSGSGLTWSCTSGSSAANVQSAINSASDQAVITLANGSYTISGLSLNGKNGITLTCATVRGCNVAAGSSFASIDSVPSNRTNLIRISGFVFTGSPGTALIWYFGSANIEKLRIDNNTFSSLPGSSIAILLGEISATGRFYGVIDHNIFSGANNFMGLKVISAETWATGLQGGANNLFVEDNTVNFTTNSDLGTGFFDAWKAVGVVVRYNSITNARIVNHSLCHGGPTNSEVYNNTVTSPTGSPPQYRNIHFQGSGETMVWGNTVSGSTGGHIALQHYRSEAAQMPQGDCTAAEVCDGDFTASSDIPQTDGNRAGQNGYPCWHQPGRDGAGTLRPVYIWNNRNTSGALVSVSIESGGLIGSHLVANRDYFEAVSAGAQSSPTSPFNGTTGMGFGTLANRPTTCSVGGTQAADAGNGGVGYFATDVGSQGTLYRCSATNTWTQHYVPYTYPHPLISGGLLAAPTNLHWEPF